MKKYVMDAVNELLSSDKNVVEFVLKSKNDYKRNFFSLFYNKFILLVQQKIIPCHLKNFILRTTGMKIGYDACIPHDIYFDPYFPELIYLRKGCLVGGGSRFITHKVKDNRLTLGKCVIAERTLFGGCSDMMPGSKLSKNSMLMFFSVLDKEIPEGELWAGKPAKLLTKFSKEDIEKFHKPSKKDKNYHREFKKQLKAFLDDPEKTFFKIHYDGNRLNAGDDWWRARNVIRTWWNGIIIEITRRLPNSFIKTALLRMAGMKIGKNVKIGNRVVFDHLFCDNITIEDDVTIEDDCYLDGHEYTITQTIFGKTLLKKGVHLKHHTYVRTGTTIGENTVIEPYSMAQREIPANEHWGGSPAKPLK